MTHHDGNYYYDYIDPWLLNRRQPLAKPKVNDIKVMPQNKSLMRSWTTCTFLHDTIQSSRLKLFDCVNIPVGSQ